MVQAENTPTPASVLQVLKADRLIAVGRDLEIAVDATAKRGKDVLIQKLTGPGLELPRLLRVLGRDELREACRVHGIPDESRSRTELAERLIKAAGVEHVSIPPTQSELRPHLGDVVLVRQRQYLVERIDAGDRGVVHLVCLDDDAQGRRLSVAWELELGARVLAPESTGLGSVSGVDDPRAFAAYFHALKWSCVSATDAKLFQSPFRAGIKLMNHQLTALKKALELPRVNLFIADDVGLGKTIEAGLVLQELVLRQRVDFVVIICPASVLLQWRDEMDRRFGLGFEIYNRAFVQRRRQERGFGVNPWDTHNRFIISYQTLRRPEYRDPLLASLGDRAKKSMLIMDEAHTAAPSSSNMLYSVDSNITKVIRDVAPRFENRLFLSATPHNGHSNSFSSLLEILDEKRFTRGVEVDPAELEPVMVRRLKEDLRQLKVDAFALRRVGAVELTHANGRWTSQNRWHDKTLDDAVDVGAADDAELELARLLTEYTSLMKPERGPGRLVFINLQKRLLSSVEAFYRTLRKHADGLGKASATAMFRHLDDEDAELPLGLDDDDRDEEDGEEMQALSGALETPAGKAKSLLERMLQLAEQHRAAPDAKVRALVAWLQKNVCDALTLDEQTKIPKKVTWQPRRVILFTEYGDTKRQLHTLLTGMASRLPDGEGRVLQLHGGMSDEQRDFVQKAFNAPPDENPVRILVCTDAAREGINLQAWCADLFHIDVPWNPGRMEQRNGRIDRTLQPSPEVRCQYFSYTQREEDRVLDVLVEKVERIQKELGSVGQVVMERIEATLQDGLQQSLIPRIEAAAAEGDTRRRVASVELEGQRDLKRLKVEIDQAAKILNDSQKIMGFDPALLRDALDVGLELSGFQRFTAAGEVDDSTGGIVGRKLTAWKVPETSASWARTIDKLRPAREREESFWEWRDRAPQPVVFEPPQRLRDDVVHLHLAHPFVQRVLSRFLAQGFSAQDLSRVTVVRNKHDHVARVIVLGRLTLFGPGALRLHDELIGVAAEWNETKTGNHLKPFSVDDDRRALAMLEQIFAETQGIGLIPVPVRDQFVRAAPGDLAALWKHVDAEADARAHEATQKLNERGTREAAALERILKNQKAVIDKKLRGTTLELFDSAVIGPAASADDRRSAKEQWRKEREYMEGRLVQIDKELRTEPLELAQAYATALRRVVPVGVVYLWPETR
jgi:ERCC4-related helicase